MLCAGCGGAGSQNNNIVPPTNASTTTPDQTSYAPVPITGGATGSSYNFIVTNGNGTKSYVNAYVPPGMNIAQGDPVAILPLTFPVNASAGTAGSGILHKAATRGGPPAGEIFINGVDSLTQLVNGNVILQPGFATLENIAVDAAGGLLSVNVSGPISIGSGASKLDILGDGGVLPGGGTDPTYSALTVTWAKQSTSGYGFTPSSYPVHTAYSLPANGGDMYQSNMTMHFATGTAGFGTMEVDYPGISKTYSNTFASGTDLDITDPKQDPADYLPPGGISSVEFTLFTLVGAA